MFLFGFILYIQSNIITLTSEYHFLSQKSLFTDIERSMLSGSKTAHTWRHLPALSKTCFGKNVHIELRTLKSSKLRFYSVSGHIYI